MNTSLQAVNQNQDLTSQFTPKELELITHTIAKGATPEELQLFLYRCKLLQLNPLKPGQIFFIKYGQGPGTIVVGIDGFRSNYGRTGKHVSTTRGVHKDEHGNITHGWCKVIRLDAKGNPQEYYEETPMNEYNNDRNPSWKKMPETMIKKCAEAATLRMAYPDELGGVYLQEEVENLDQTPVKKPWIEQPNADDGDQTAQSLKPYIVKFGSFAKRTIPEAIREFGPKKVEHAITLCEAKLEKNEVYANVTRAEMVEFVELASKALAAFERGELEYDEKPKRGFVAPKEDPNTFKSTEEDIPF